MSERAGADARAVACPYLGLTADRRAPTRYPSDDHRCFRTAPHSPASLQHQVVFCLGAGHSDCSRFRAYPVALPAVRVPLYSGVAIVAVCAAAAVAAVIVVGNPLTAEPEPSATTPAAGAARVTAAPPSPGPLVLGSVSPPAISPRVTSTPRPVVTARTATPAAFAGTYIVQRSDSLTTLAQHYGVTVPELAAANALSPAARLTIGQHLRVPAAMPTPGVPR
ncbi:MAG: LysM peptidoglycan-binding domain-containing protein [Dehalococcoidia bacterium]